MESINIKYIVVHCSAHKYTDDIGVAEIREIHLARGFSDIGYHYVIKRDGTLQQGRPLEKQGAHVKGINEVSWGVCLVGGLDLDLKPQCNYTYHQYVTLDRILNKLAAKAINATVTGHRDLSPDLNGDGRISKNEYMKECPCFNVAEFYYSTK